MGNDWTPVADYAGKSYSVKTNSDGYYEFVNLKSGTYRVVLPNVEREAGTNVVASINGATGVDAKDGDLPQAFTNRFDVTKPTVQTVSHRQFDKFSSSNPEVRVEKDSTLENVNFGYLLEKSDLTLDKSPATVTNSLYDSTVKWTVDITNTGKTPIDGAKLFDRTSKEVVGFQGSISYKKIENEITGTPVAAFNEFPLDYDSYSVVASTDGFWLRNYAGDLVKVRGITGTPVAVTEDAFGVATTDGYWFVKPDGSSVKVNGITGTPVAVAGYAHSLYSGSSIATTEGYWLIQSDGSTTKVSGITGTPVAVTGNYPTNNGSAVATTDGYWLVNYKGSATKVNGITGTPVAVTGYYPTDFGSSIATTEGYWLVKLDGSSVKVNGITGTPVAVTGSAPVDPDDSDNPELSTYKGIGSSVATSDGYWLVG